MKMMKNLEKPHSSYPPCPHTVPGNKLCPHMHVYPPDVPCLQTQEAAHFSHSHDFAKTTYH